MLPTAKGDVRRECLYYDGLVLTPRFADAFAYALDAHAGQTKKGTNVPYIAHLMDVTALVLMHGGHEDEAIGALLHDAAEDAGGRARLDDIRQRFGDAVADVVEGCSDTLETPKPPWLQRKTAYIEHLPEVSASTRLVSAADKLANVRTIGAASSRPVGEGGSNGPSLKVQVDELIELPFKAVEALVNTGEPSVHLRLEPCEDELGVLPLLKDRLIDRVEPPVHLLEPPIHRRGEVVYLHGHPVQLQFDGLNTPLHSFKTSLDSLKTSFHCMNALGEGIDPVGHRFFDL